MERAGDLSYGSLGVMAWRDLGAVWFCLKVPVLKSTSHCEVLGKWKERYPDVLFRPGASGSWIHEPKQTSCFYKTSGMLLQKWKDRQNIDAIKWVVFADVGDLL